MEQSKNSRRQSGTSRKKPKVRSRRVKFCPKCGSTNIYWASGLAQLWSIWECRNCGYYGAFIVEDGRLAQKLQEDYAKRKPHHLAIDNPKDEKSNEQTDRHD
jgi:DNA-directed RNA polymerase subunit M